PFYLKARPSSKCPFGSRGFRRTACRYSRMAPLKSLAAKSVSPLAKCSAEESAGVGMGHVPRTRARARKPSFIIASLGTGRRFRRERVRHFLYHNLCLPRRPWVLTVIRPSNSRPRSNNGSGVATRCFMLYKVFLQHWRCKDSFIDFLYRRLEVCAHPSSRQ